MNKSLAQIAIELAGQIVVLGTKFRRREARLLVERKAKRLTSQARFQDLEERTEEALTETLNRMFNRQIRSATGKLLDLETKSISQTATNLSEIIFDPTEWDEELVNRTLPILARAMADAMVGILVELGIDLTKLKGSLWSKASTASEWLAANDRELPEGLEFELEDGQQFSLQFETEYPLWMKEEIAERLHETYEQDFWKEINTTSHSDIEKFLDVGIKDGWSINRMAREMAGSLGGGAYGKMRGKRIARTESGHVLNAARTASIDQLKAELGPEVSEFIKRMWNSVLGNTTRDDHAVSDGTFEDEDGNFSVGGETARWPRDIQLSAGQRCNCQCYISAELGVGAPEGEIQQIIQEMGLEDSSRKMPPANPDGKSTIERFKKDDGTWTKERQALHNKIIDEHFEGKSPVKNPNSYMLGGGPASGKSTVLDAGLVKIPKNIVMIDSDGIKDSLPEYTAMLKAKNKGAASFVHEESSHISKRIMSRALEEKHNVVLDGTGDSSLKSLRKKSIKLRAGGRKVNADYMTIKTDLSVKIADIRGEKTGRFVPESVVRGIHSSVSRVVPQAIDEGLYDNLNVWDNNIKGKPVLIASAKGKKLTVHDKDKWEEFLAKGKEGI